MVTQFSIFILVFFSCLFSWSAVKSKGSRLSPVTSERIYGVTIDSIENLPAIIKSLKSLKFKPTTRIVFDENEEASTYEDAAAQIHEVSFVMGEILDSFFVKDISTEDYTARTKEYLNALGNNVDIWEIGNEINGEWLGDTASVVAKMNAAYEVIKGKKKPAALTLYYNEGCWEKKSNEMFTWARKNISEDMKQGLDYVFISYYEDDCNDLQPDWPQVFKELAALFPKSKIGFGEVGTKHTARKKDYINRYYNLKINQPNFVGGYFWWYFSQDMVPSSKPLLNTLNAAIIKSKKSSK